jgi:arginyl-tRNA synthetase
VSVWLSAGNKDHGARVLGEDPALTAARLVLVRAARIHLAEGLRLLGLDAPERM